MSLNINMYTLYQTIDHLKEKKQMELQFLTQNDKIGIIFNEDGLNSDILMLDLKEATSLIEQTKLALSKETDKATVFQSDKFSYIKQHNSMFLLSIGLTDYYAAGKYLRYNQMKRIISQVQRLIKTIKV